MKCGDRWFQRCTVRGAHLVCAMWQTVLLGLASSVAQPPTETLAEKLFNSPTYDVLVLKEGATELMLAPLEMQPRRPLQRGSDEELLVVRLKNRPEQQYQVAWGDVERVQLFEELLLSAAAEEARQDRFDSAWVCLERVRTSNAEFPGLIDVELSSLYLEAGYWHQQGQSDRALGLLHEVQRRAPEYPRLADAYGAVVDRLVQAHLQSDNLLAVRGLLGELAKRFPEHPVLQSYEGLLATRAAASVSTAEAAVAAGQLREAWVAVREALAWQPNDAAALALHQRLVAEYPVIRVGVVLPYSTDAAQSWAAERVSWLLYRRLCEPLVGSATSVGPGLVAVEQQDATLHLRVVSSTGQQQGDLFRRLLTPTPELKSAWRALVANCEVAGPGEFLVHLRGPIEEFSPLLTMPLRSGEEATKSLAADYAVWESLGEEAVFRYESDNPRPAGQAAEIVERQLAPEEISRALQRGDVDLVDRVPIQELNRVRAVPGVTLALYARPTRLLLAFSPRFSGGSASWLRRLLAASAALSRSSLVDEKLGADAPRALFSCLTTEAISAPEYGLSARDLVRLWSFELQANADQGRPIPTVRLAYCSSTNTEAIVQRLGDLWLEQFPGLNLQLTPLAGDGWPSSDETSWDACCVEFRSNGARLDASMLFGEEGLIGRASPELHVLCGQVVTASSAADLSARVADLERLAVQQAALVPLVEWTEHAAVGPTLSIPPEPFVGLYQRLANWRHHAEAAP